MELCMRHKLPIKVHSRHFQFAIFETNSIFCPITVSRWNSLVHGCYINNVSYVSTTLVHSKMRMHNDEQMFPFKKYSQQEILQDSVQSAECSEPLYELWCSCPQEDHLEHGIRKTGVADLAESAATFQLIPLLFWLICIFSLMKCKIDEMRKEMLLALLKRLIANNNGKAAAIVATLC